MWLPLLVFLWGVLAVSVWVSLLFLFVPGLLGFCLGWGGNERGLGHLKVSSDVGLPVGLSLGLVTEVSIACASDQRDAVPCFVSLAWVGGLPPNRS